MRALRIESVGKVAAADVPDPVPGTGEALVELRAAALNHRDVWIKLGQYAGLRFPCIPGSDGAGVVSAVGPGADAGWVGREVVINPSFDWGLSPGAQGPSFSILGLPRDGTLAEMIAVPQAQLAGKPGHLSWEEAAALPLAGEVGWGTSQAPGADGGCARPAPTRPPAQAGEGSGGTFAGRLIGKRGFR